MSILHKKIFIIAVVVVSSMVMGISAEACTTAIITKGASKNGEMFVTHSNDAICDPSIVYVPAKDHAVGEMRKVYPAAIAKHELPEYNCMNTPRLQAPERADGYNNPSLQKENTIPLGEIPEVAHTYAYLDSDYGIMNEHGLMLGECTDHSYLDNVEISADGGIFYAAELGRIALERCKTAREAVELIGDLVTNYGLYATPETLLVADKDEGWVIEMQPLLNQKTAYWVAQKVPDGEVFVAANQFRIREISVDNPDQILSPNLIAELKKAGLARYDSISGQVDWLTSIQGVEGYHPYFSMRRVWRFYDLIAPSKNFPAKLTGYDDKAYPFSVRPDKKITREDVMEIHRDYFSGTKFDPALKTSSGVFGSPVRYGKNTFERSIYTLKSTYTWILEASPKFSIPIAWIALATPGDSTYVPLAVAPLPKGYEKVNREQYDSTVPWWNYTAVSELIRAHYNLMAPEVMKVAHEQETSSGKLLLSLRNKEEGEIAAALNKNALKTQKRWQELLGELMVKYCQGCNISLPAEQTVFDADVAEY